MRRQNLPIVIKADGLAAGKGVVIAETRADATAAIDACFAGAFGAAGSEVVIEEFLDGEEASFFALCDGANVLALATAQDHKRVGDGDVGPNTGGMGAYSPAPVMTPDIVSRTMDEIIKPTVAGMIKRGTPFKGVLFAGLMIGKEGPKLIEYNVRFGDPECQVLMLRLKSDFLTALLATADGALKSFDLRWHDDAALTVVMAGNGYPGEPLKGTEIKGLAAAAQVDGVEIFHAGTKADGGRILANGGRVLCVTARGKSVAAAQSKAYAAIDKIDWPGGFCRRDIGWRAIARENSRIMMTIDLFPGFETPRHRPRLRNHSRPHRRLRPAAAAAARLSANTRLLASRRAQHSRANSRSSSPTCAATAPATARPATPPTQPTPSASWPLRCATSWQRSATTTFIAAGHDRGARVAYRLALDHPACVRALIPLDILPTAEVWRRITAESARGGYHWQFLAQPKPMPETLIGGAPR